MIQPINGNFLIKPIAQKSLFSNGKYEEMGEVLALPHKLIRDGKGTDVLEMNSEISVGDKVFFDSWRCGKYPSGEQDENGEEIYFWLVMYEDIKAVEKKEDGI